jgi:peptidase S41-like protein
MSEKIYAWLLRLYPSRFREAYGDEALQLFRDRARDERGLLPRLRLWLDLLGDLVLSVSREYFHVQPELTSYSAHLGSEGRPSFFVLTDESLGPGALLFGGVLSLVALVAFSVLLNHGVKHLPLSALIRPTPGAAEERSSHFNPPAPKAAGDTGAATTASTSQQQPAMASTSSQSDNGEASDAQSHALQPPPGSMQPFPQRSQLPRRASSSVLGDAKLSAAERHRVIDGAIGNLKRYYVYPDVAKKMADALMAHEKNGDDDAATDGEAFANLLTRQMREVSPDRHLTLDYSEAPLPSHPTGQTPEGIARYREAMKQQSCTFEKVAILPHNIGYLKLNSFPDLSVCQPTAAAAMASLNHADAIIFDLRDNRGGYPSMVMLIAAYLFDHPEYMYNPRENTTERSWTQSPVPGNRLADKPVYVLTSARTFSGAEHFSYDLKMLKRATLVGETTGGATDVGVFHRIDDHFGMGIRETPAINPYSEPDWAVTGVEPDVKVKAADALEVAKKLAFSKLQK